MIHELSIFNTYGLLIPTKIIIILEIADTHLVHFQLFVHFKDLEVGGTLCDLQALQGRMYVTGILGIPVIAWLADDKITRFFIANDNWCELSALFLCKIADATLELFVRIMD